MLRATRKGGYRSSSFGSGDRYKGMRSLGWKSFSFLKKG